jgi:hypothetical protein
MTPPLKAVYSKIIKFKNMIGQSMVLAKIEPPVSNYYYNAENLNSHWFDLWFGLSVIWGMSDTSTSFGSGCPD